MKYPALLFLACLSTVAAASADTVAAPTAASPAADTHKEHEAAAIRQRAADERAKRRKALVVEALQANDEIMQSIQDLDDGNKDAAYKLLTDASGKLDVVLGRDPALKEAPVGVDTTIRDNEMTPADIKAAIKAAAKSLDHGKVQEARSQLRPLVSEITVTSGYLPMNTYPAAIKVAVGQMHDGKLDDAAMTLSGAISSIIVEKQHIPLPPLKAEADVQQAEQVATSNPAQARALLDMADEQLEVGKLLGYGEARDVRAELKSVKQKLAASSPQPGIFGHLKDMLHDLTSKL